ncbi:pentatricopeptide repeat-containing protein [Dorcoceras hygrometricum]|uniref:Pentatricopeptide repeat-containing protein n=1 Tax=Dorcoceras hygrometricum TaxID=472368 RepID=A0A2Z7AXT3_9LAMI|nr:pentatricopeptide repeat-containing protein [Dorcoceras hygrometricum]
MASFFDLLWSESSLFSRILKASVQCRSLFVAQQLHSIMITGGRSRFKFWSNHLINAYAKLGVLNFAFNLFDRMPQRNVMSYNILLGGYIQNGELGAAVEVFNEMGERNSATWNAIITGLIKFEDNEEGLRLFLKMHACGFLPDAYTLGSILRGCAGLKDLNRGKQAHGYAIRSGLEFDLIVGSSLANMYMRSGCLREGGNVIQLLPVHNVVACNTLIAGLVQNGCPVGALDQYNIMKMAGFRPDKITFVSVISSCSELVTLGQGQKIHAEAIKAGAMSVAGVISSLVSMYSRCGCLDYAATVFWEKEGVQEDLVLWTAMIAAYGLHGRGQEAIELFERMELQGLQANDVTFLSLLYSCSHCGLRDKGLEFFDLMLHKYGLQPQVKHHTCIVDLLGRAGRLEEAEAFIQSMPVKPDVVIWKTLLSACKIHKNADMAERICEEILKIDPQDSASYVLLANTQASAKRWLDVSEVRKTMRERMVKKEPGISWFEKKNQVHSFATGDQSHPQSEEIELYLKKLTDELKLHGYVPDTGVVLQDMDTEEKEFSLAHHSEKLALAYALMNTPDGVAIRIMKNLRVCDDCHVVIKYISIVRNREIIVRDATRFHHFKNGHCSCRDYW